MIMPRDASDRTTGAASEPLATEWRPAGRLIDAVQLALIGERRAVI
jgi:hypothetical protein